MKILITIVSLMVSSMGIASPLAIPNTFAPNTPAKAEQVNGNFSAIASSVNDNDARIGQAESRMTTIEAATGLSSQMLSYELTGKVTVPAGSPTVTGVDTLFTGELNVGDAIKIKNEKFIVIAIESDLALTLSGNHVAGALGELAYKDGNLFSINNGNGVNQLFVDKSGSVIRRIARATGTGTDGADTGQIVSRVLQFHKSNDDTAIRIGYSDNWRVYSHDRACRWEIRIKTGADAAVSCPGGGLIYDFYIAGVTAINHYRSGSVFGYCEGIAAGNHEIQVWVSATPGYSGSDCYTGWSGTRWTIEAEEVY